MKDLTPEIVQDLEILTINQTAMMAERREQDLTAMLETQHMETSVRMLMEIVRAYHVQLIAAARIINELQNEKTHKNIYEVL